MIKSENTPIKIPSYQDDDFSSVTTLEDAGIHTIYRSAVFIRQMSACCPDSFLVAVDGTHPVGYFYWCECPEYSGTGMVSPNNSFRKIPGKRYQDCSNFNDGRSAHG
jgi:hypothetical protein